MKRLLAALRRIIIESYKNPLALVQLLTVLMLLTAFVLAIVDWISFRDRVQVEVPLLLVGVAAILTIVVRTSQGFSLSVAVIIIGTVVAGDRFMLAITALLKGDPEHTTKFVSDLYGSSESLASELVDHDKLAQTIVDLLEEKSIKPEQATSVVARVLDRAEAVEIAERIREAGAATPFRHLIEGGNEWQDFAGTYEHSSFFQEHMDILSSLGVATFEEGAYGDARLTARGQEVAPFLQPFDSSAIVREVLPLGPDLTDHPPPEVQELTMGTMNVGEFSTSSRNWFQFAVDDAGEYVVKTTEIEGETFVDTVVILLASDKSTVVKQDDDSGSGFFSKLQAQLEPGLFYLEVKRFQPR